MLGGWSRGKVSNYIALESINKETWSLIVATFQNMATENKEGMATALVATATITERLLRNILCLTPDQQHELVSDLIAGNTTKGGLLKEKSF